MHPLRSGTCGFGGYAISPPALLACACGSSDPPTLPPNGNICDECCICKDEGLRAHKCALDVHPSHWGDKPQIGQSPGAAASVGPLIILGLVAPDTEAVDPDALAEQIRGVSGVQAARVVADGAGRIAEIHVVADSGKSPKQVVRDIQTLAQAGFGLAIDYRIVGVVQLDRSTAGPDGPRAQLESVSWRVSGGRMSCRVELSCGGGQAAGEAEAPSGSRGRQRLAALATIDALVTLNARHVLWLDDATLVDFGGQSVAVSRVVVTEPDGERTLVGAALVRSDDVEAVARATLDAVNRRLSRASG